MRILLTGAAGQFGRAFQEHVQPTVSLTRVGHAAGPFVDAVLDLGRSGEVAPLVRASRPDWIVHAAAMTNVDGCEQDPALAMRINADATGELAAAAAEVGARMAYISTDYVYDGSAGPYSESAPVNPVSEYGRSKLMGEEAARSRLPNVLVCRTSVVFGAHKNNFVVWVRDQLRQEKSIKIVTDQFVTPTYTYDLAAQVLALVQRGSEGVFHTAGADGMSRWEMAHAIARAYGLDASLLQPVESKDLRWIARRPLDSRLLTQKVSELIKPWPFSKALAHLREKEQG